MYRPPTLKARVEPDPLFNHEELTTSELPDELNPMQFKSHSKKEMVRWALYLVGNYSWFGIQGNMIVDSKVRGYKCGNVFYMSRSQDKWCQTLENQFFTKYAYVFDVANTLRNILAGNEALESNVQKSYCPESEWVVLLNASTA